MILSFSQLFGAQEAPRVPILPAGQRVYAVGDIHGRNDLFAALITAIELDDRDREPADTTIVLLGDLVDRGPDSAGVLARARMWQNSRKVRILCGNHEEMLLESLFSLETLRVFLRHGGRETLLSFGIDPALYFSATYTQLQSLMTTHIPVAMVDFMRSFEDQIQIGDYLFVHAGVRPGVPQHEQRRADLLWIREPFLSHAGDLGVVVVHGHSISELPEFRNHRIGIDTGAYFTGNLTAIGLEGTRRWLIEACDNGQGISTSINCAA